MNQLDELLKLMLELEKRIEFLENNLSHEEGRLSDMIRGLKECFGKVEGLM